MNLLPVDNLNVMQKTLRHKKGRAGSIGRKEAEDVVLDYLIVAYIAGVEAANKMIGLNILPDLEQMQEAIYRKFENKNFADRVREHADQGDVSGIMLVADTDGHRVYNAGIVNTGKNSRKRLSKVWHTEKDDRVRDTHAYLEGISVEIDTPFYTYDGDSAMAPGDFTLVSNNANCRCWIDLVPNERL